MKVFSYHLSRSQAVRCVKIAFALALVATVSACVSSNILFKQANSSLPIEVIQTGSGQIMSSRAHETSDRLYVTGTTRLFLSNAAAHVDIQLVDETGGIIAEKRDGIETSHPRTARARNRNLRYVASFPLSEAQQAAKIRVVYHSDVHRGSNS
jgi:hypothetical protein